MKAKSSQSLAEASSSSFQEGMTEEDRSRILERLQRTFGEFQGKGSITFCSDVMMLAIDDLIAFAARRFGKDERAAGASGKFSVEGKTRAFARDLRQLVNEHQDGTRKIMFESMAGFGLNRPDVARQFVRRYADRLAYYIIYGHFRNWLPADGIAHVLMCRVVENLILNRDPCSQIFGRRRVPTEDDILLCVETMLLNKAACDGHELQQTLSYFSTKCHAALVSTFKRRKDEEGQHAFSLDHTDELPGVTLMHGRTSIGTENPSDNTGDHFSVLEHLPDLYPLFVRRFGRESAIGFWIVSVLYEEFGLPLESVSRQIQSATCPRYLQNCLPPDSDWSEISQIFRGMLTDSFNNPREAVFKLQEYYSKLRPTMRTYRTFRGLASKMSFKQAVKCYVLTILEDKDLPKTRNRQDAKWAPIMGILNARGCGYLSGNMDVCVGALELMGRKRICAHIHDGDLPPQISWEDVRTVLKKPWHTVAAVKRTSQRCLRKANTV